MCVRTRKCQKGVGPQSAWLKGPLRPLLNTCINYSNADINRFLDHIVSGLWEYAANVDYRQHFSQL